MPLLLPVGGGCGPGKVFVAVADDDSETGLVEDAVVPSIGLIVEVEQPDSPTAATQAATTSDGAWRISRPRSPGKPRSCPRCNHPGSCTTTPLPEIDRCPVGHHQDPS